MIDPHVHCRDWQQSYKETIEHALRVAERAGLQAIFDMPNTIPPITTRELAKKRIEDADRAKSSVFYGLYMGITSDTEQIREAVKTYKEFFPRVVGLKMFTTYPVPEISIDDEDKQKKVYKILTDEKYPGVLAVHCEKESLIKDNIDPLSPTAHFYARPEEAEILSVQDQIRFAKDANFTGKLHITHISVPDSVDMVLEQKLKGMKISCGATPHHCTLFIKRLINSENPFLYKVNPPIRKQSSVAKMNYCLKRGKIDLIETDHAPHTLNDKLESPHFSGFPGLPFLPHFCEHLRTEGFSERDIDNLTHYNACRIFGIDIPIKKIKPEFGLHREYEVDVYKGVRWKLRNKK